MVNKVLLALSALIVAVAFPRPAAAWFDTAQLQSVCEAGLQNPSIDNAKYAMCTGLVIGILTADSMEKSIICVPPNLDTKTALKVFVARAAAEPDKRIDGTITLYRAFAEKYPCR